MGAEIYSQDAKSRHSSFPSSGVARCVATFWCFPSAGSHPYLAVFCMPRRCGRGCHICRNPRRVLRTVIPSINVVQNCTSRACRRVASGCRLARVCSYPHMCRFHWFFWCCIGWAPRIEFPGQHVYVFSAGVLPCHSLAWQASSASSHRGIICNH